MKPNKKRGQKKKRTPKNEAHVLVQRHTGETSKHFIDANQIGISQWNNRCVYCGSNPFCLESSFIQKHHTVMAHYGI